MGEISLIRVVNDLVAFALLFVAWIILKLVIKPTQLGFFCNDFSVNMPFKSSTVSNLALIIGSIIMPILIIILTELLKHAYGCRYKKVSTNGQHQQFALTLPGMKKQFIISPLVRNLYISLGTFVLGVLLTYIFHQLGKKTIGRLRPNFLDVCKPNVNPYSELCAKRGFTYIVPDVDITCMSGNTTAIMESKLSFPSGHSSSSFYGSVFLILYVNREWSQELLGAWIHFFQAAYAAFAVFTSLSRVIDNKHHPTDVLAGATLGLILAIFTFYYLRSAHKRSRSVAKSSNHESSKSPIPPAGDVKAMDETM